MARSRLKTAHHKRPQGYSAAKAVCDGNCIYSPPASLRGRFPIPRETFRPSYRNLTLRDMNRGLAQFLWPPEFPLISSTKDPFFDPSQQVALLRLEALHGQRDRHHAGHHNTEQDDLQ